MIRLLIAVAAMLALAGCQTNSKVDKAIADNLPKICSGSAQLHSAFLVVAATGK
jgi:outer membrane murein-binding lipoprotein Lpp